MDPEFRGMLHNDPSDGQINATELDRSGHDGHSYQNINATGNAVIHAGDIHQNFHRDTSTQELECHRVFKTGPYEQQKNINPLRVEGTCQWVLNHQQFKNWRQNKQNTLLWISADPGCGKSVLAKSLVDQDLGNDGRETICYFFFKDNEKQDSLATALCALLHQIYAQQPTLIRHAISAWRANGDRLQYETLELWRILRQSATDPTTPIICILDALDECNDIDRKQLIELLCTLQQQGTDSETAHSLKVLVTSRPYDNVQKWFSRTVRQWPQIHLRGEEENDQINLEINLVIAERVRSFAEEFELPSSTCKELQDKLVRMQHRTYLWLHLVIDEIRQAYADNPYPQEVTIPRLSSSVEEAYEGILRKITPQQKHNAQRVLRIIIGARRPLTIGEMACALGAARSYELDTTSIQVLNAQRLEQQIRHWCGLFIFIQHSQLFLVHQTAKEFLLSHDAIVRTTSTTWQSSLTTFEVEHEMTCICIFNLFKSHSSLGSTHEDREQARYSTTNSDNESFSAYCAEFWFMHSQDERHFDDTRLLNHALALYDTEGSLFQTWFPQMWKTIDQYGPPPTLHDQHAAAMTGHSNVLNELFKRYQLNIFLLEMRDSSRRTPLIWAAELGRDKAVEWILNKGANADAPGGIYGNALMAASIKGHNKVIRILLDKGANVNVPGGAYATALQAASAKGYEQVVSMLLNKGADVNVQGGMYGTALQAALVEGHEQIVRILLNKGADVNAKGGRFHTALLAATDKGNKQIVEMLLDSGADVDGQGRISGTALQMACSRGYEHIVQILLHRGADVNAEGGKYKTALKIASFHGHEQVVKTLLKRGAEVNAQGGTYHTALQAASVRGRERIVQILLDNGADVNAKGGKYKTALHVALRHGHGQIVKILLENGADIYAEDGGYSTVLVEASAAGNEGLVQVLVDKVAHINEKVRGHAICEASVRGYLRIVQILLDGYADVNFQGKWYQLALHVAKTKGYVQIWQLLCDKMQEVQGS